MISPLQFGSLTIKAPDKNGPVTVTAKFDGSCATTLEWWNGSYETRFAEVAGIAPGAPSDQSLREAPGKLKAFLTNTLPGKLVGDGMSGFVAQMAANFFQEKLTNMKTLPGRTPSQTETANADVHVTWVAEDMKEAHNFGVKPRDFSLHGELPTGLIYPDKT